MVATESKLYIYGAIAIGVLGVFASFISASGGGVLSLIGGLMAGIGAVLTIGFYKYGYVLIPIITKTTNTSTSAEASYEIPPTQDVIVKGTEGIYYATIFLGIKIFESMTEKSAEETVTYNEYFERAISNLKNVTKVAYMLYTEDISEKRRTIEAKRAEAQLRLAREKDRPDPDVLRIDKLEREVAVWDLQLNQLIKGMKPMGVVAYAMTTATATSKEGAVAAARGQANELRSVLANSLNVEVEVLTGDEMLKCFEWERFMPITAKELEESIV